ncbi:hypothetical protein ANCCAN_22554 [Ancylostoma caninum]|uniref:Uncharacterized protein n=1 Tax=Ancylostoma caninum TaxID=29170 RepID=A0A368FLG2_ANCCA|nr:hypothetical protein ANCCAN_22554 [Ancylostoma caninum]
MTVARLTLLLVAFVMLDASEILKTYDYCYASTEAVNSLAGNATPTVSQLPDWCKAMRHDVAPCIAEAIKIEDDGSLASRGNVLLTVYERTGNATILIHVKLYYYACVYNNWYSFAENKPCYNAPIPCLQKHAVGVCIWKQKLLLYAVRNAERKELQDVGDVEWRTDVRIHKRI